MHTFTLLGFAWALAALSMGVLWLVQRRTRDATTVDVAWAALLGVLAVLYAVLGEGLPARRVLVALMVASATWRLALHLWFDRARKGVEDGRYAALRAKWGPAAQRNFFWFFQAQALLDVLLSLPFLLACNSSAPSGALDLAGLVLWAVAICGEALADAQLAAFKADPAQRGRTCRRGLWSLSRHPNYFFQWLLWCAYALLALSAPAGWIGFASPLLMLALILFVTGIPPTETQALRSRGEDYREYQRTTSAFVPWFRKHAAQRRTV
jgi:steroid 5-alpha reductase family enzyme